MSNDQVYVSLEFTPNPNTLKYSVNRQILGRGAVNITTREAAAQRSPLAARLFDVPGISGVMIGTDFVTITKADSGDWDAVHKSASSIIEAHLTAGEPVVNEAALAEEDARGKVPGAASDAERRIREILDSEIRPAVAMDGGDISFDKYEDGVVYLHMKGSCSGCPSSTMTLKMGIENRLREVVPEIREVVAV